MKVTMIPIIINTLGRIPKELIKRLEDFETRRQVVTIQTRELLRSARILRRVLETWGDLLLRKLQWKSICYRWCKKLTRKNNNDYNDNNNDNMNQIILPPAMGK